MLNSNSYVESNPEEELESKPVEEPEHEFEPKFSLIWL